MIQIFPSIFSTISNKSKMWKRKNSRHLLIHSLFFNRRQMPALLAIHKNKLVSTNDVPGYVYISL